ncbi:MAG: DUF2333 family protein [Alphaproteobacteria bacterium]|nr:DUF2333 family protein [Alphaproteobacteria bacterium]
MSDPIRTERVVGDPGQAPSVASAPVRRHGLPWGGLAVAALLCLLLYYPIGMLIVHKVDDDASFAAPEAERVEGGSRAVDIAAALIDREAGRGHWAANDPFFLPGSALDNMPSFQQGILRSLARFAFELTDQIARARGSSQTDKDLQEAAGLLQYSGTKWIFDLRVSLAPTATSEAQYRAARKALLRYNIRLAKGEAVFERRADNLLAAIDRIALDLGSTSAALDEATRRGGGWFDFEADDVFYGIKGQLYAYHLVLRELGLDYGNIMKEKELGATWAQMLDSLRRGAELDPLVVVNGAPDSLLLPSHLAVQGFFLLRARTQLREITNILLK